jgi:hypothetical protein
MAVTWNLTKLGGLNYTALSISGTSGRQSANGLRLARLLSGRPESGCVNHPKVRDFGSKKYTATWDTGIASSGALAAQPQPQTNVHPCVGRRTP